MARQATPVDDFHVGAGCLTDPTSAEVIRQRAARTKDTLDKAGDIRPQGHLSGSFICAHPPDYRGRPAHHFSFEDWRSLFREFKELGMDTVIWQASAWRELKECYYPSKRLADYRQWNVVEPMIEAANAEAMVLYLGSFGTLGGGDEALGIADGDMDKAVAAAETDLATVDELLTLYGGTFQGFYLTSEVCYMPERPKHTYTHFATFFERVTNEVKRRAPELKILASPAVLHIKGHERQAVEGLLACFGRCPVDAFAPMDCIGQGEDLEMLEFNLGVWREVCSTLGADFWSNCESFTVTDRYHPVMKIEPAEPRRLFYQMALAEKAGATKLVTWEAMHFLNPNGSPAAQELRLACLDLFGRPRKEPP